MTSDSERLDWIRLARTHGIGPVSFFQLIRRYGSASAALDALPDLSARSRKGRPLQPPERHLVEQELDAAYRYGARLVLSFEPDYPPLLNDLEPPPPVLTRPASC